MPRKKNPHSTVIHDISPKKQQEGKNRETGISIIGTVPWGTHLCQFYKTKDDLIDILVPYFTKGLQNNEFCMWITSEPLHANEAKKALQKAVKNLDDYIKKGQIEILESSEWYTKSGKFDSDEVLCGWVAKENWAREHGYDGLRLTGNTFWLEKKDWEDFTNYEEAVNHVIGNYKMIAICSYSLDKCNASEVIDVVSNHQFALIKREGTWHRIESPEMKKSEQEKERQAQLLDQVQDGIIGSDPDYRITHWNKGAEQMYGYSEAEAIGKTTSELLRPTYSPGEREKIIDELNRIGTSKARILTRHRNGTEIIVDVNSTRITDENGNITGYVVTYRDMTDRERAQAALREAELKYRTVAENTYDFEFWIDSKGTYLYASPSCERITGHTKEEFVNDPSLRKQLVHPDDKQTFLDHISYESLKKNPGDLEFRIIHKDGSVRWIHHVCQPLLNEKGKFLGTRGSNRDITERKKAEEQLRETHDYLENLLNYANAPIIVWDKDFKIIRFNHAFEHLTGYTSEMMIGKKLGILFPEENKEESLKKIRRTLSGEYWESVEIPILRKDKAIRLALWNSANIYDNSGKNLVATIAQGTDITERKNAEEQLRETHDYLENLLNYANAPIIVWDKDFKIKRFNHAFEHLTGYTSEMMLGKKLDTLFPQESKEESLQKIRRTLSGEYWESVEIPILRKDKAIRIALWNSANIYDNSGKNLVATIAQGTDITERKKAEDAVLQAKLEWERTFNSVPDLIAILDKSHKIVQVNKAMAQRLGIPADQCINLNCHMCVHGATKPPAFCPHTLTLKDGKEHVAEVFEDKLGGYFLVSTTPIFDNKRTLLGAVHVARDITERKQAEEALKESEKRLNRAQELAHLGSWELDLINNHLTWSDEVYRIFGLQPQEFEATYEAFLRSVHPEDRAAVDAAYSGSLREGRDTYEIEHRVVRKNGDIRVVYEKCEHIRDKSEKILQSIGMVHDITERKRTEAELVRLASFPLKNPAPIIEVDLSGTIQYLNPVSQQLFPDLEKKGFNHSFLKGIKKLIPEIQKSKTLVQEIHVNDKWFLQTITYIPENRRIRIYSTDITLRKKTEEVLQESEEKYRSIVENTTNVIMVTQPDGIISYLSPACKDVLGHDPNELVGTNPMIFHPEDVTRVQQALSRALNGIKGSNFQYRIITNDGKTKWISHSWAPIQKDSKLHSIVSVIEDITQSKIAEENIKKLNENLLRHSFELATANKELEAFSYSVSHDLRAPLRSIDGFGQAILEDYADKLDEQGKDYIQRVRTATQRMGQLIDDLLRLSRLSRAELHVEQIDLSSLARTTAEKFQASEPSRKVKITIQDQISISGDKKLLEILFENLLGNAWKFTGNTKHPMIKFGETTKDGERVYYIQDNGAGFDMAYADKLFIPFQRLHSVDEYPGTGIGLAIVSRVVRRHGGRIWAESEVDKGATFYFTLQERGVE